MLQLPNGCLCSNPSVFPKNWKTCSPTLLKKDWRIQYYFKDPTDPWMKDHPQGKLVVLKGMNAFKTLHERRNIITEMLENELYQLQHLGYNPIKKKRIAPVENKDCNILPTTHFNEALKLVLDRLSITDRTKIEIKSVLKAVNLAAKQLGLTNISIESITRRQIKNVLDRCGVNSTKWSNNRYNKFRAYLMMLYKELVELEVTPTNILRDISKKSITTRLKVVLSDGERKRIDDHLAEVFPRFRNFVHLFFHSGGRKTELLQLKPSMVNLDKQTYRCIVKKGKSCREVDRTIKSVAIPFWKYFLENCPVDHFLFGPRFEPALNPTCVEMPTRYWQEYVKVGLGINVDFYSLKHAHTTEVVDLLSEADAAKHNSHTSTAMVRMIYDVRQQDRAHDRLKGLENKFA